MDMFGRLCVIMVLNCLQNFCSYSVVTKRLWACLGGEKSLSSLMLNYIPNVFLIYNNFQATEPLIYLNHGQNQLYERNAVQHNQLCPIFIVCLVNVVIPNIHFAYSIMIM